MNNGIKGMISYPKPNKKPYTINELEHAIMDVLDGNDENDLVKLTGLTVERCRDIADLADRVFKENGY